jgi:hypothetical protein
MENVTFFISVLYNFEDSITIYDINKEAATSGRSTDALDFFCR